MLTTIQVVFIFCGFLLQQRCSAEESYGYVVNEQFKPGESVLEMTLSQLQQMFMSGGGDTNDTTQSRDECMASARAYLCKKTFQFNNQCANEHSIQDRESIEETCKKARMDCSANATDVQISFINVLFNCSMPIEKIEPTKQVKCERFPEVKDDPFPCAERKYKVRLLFYILACKYRQLRHCDQTPSTFVKTCVCKNFWKKLLKETAEYIK